MNYIHFILFTVLTNAAAQVMLKHGMMTLGPIQIAGPATLPSIIIMIFKIVFHPWVFIGLCTFVISMASHLFVLSKVELSFAYPFLSLAYVAVAVFAWAVFKEDMNLWKISGIALICAGTILIAQGGTSEHQNESSKLASAPTASAEFKEKIQ